MSETKLIRREAMEITVPQLPEDAVANILSRLPVKYLLQYKCVCKPWRSLILDPHFAKLQISQSKSSNTSCHRFLHLTAPLQSVHCEDSCDDPDLDHVSHLEFPAVMKNIPGFDNYVGRLKIGGSCNGLICILFPNGRIFLWNPTIREAVEINSGDIEPKGYYVYGLGYDSSTDDYKLFRACNQRTPAVTYSAKSKVEILTLKSNTWRKVEEEPRHDYAFEGVHGIFFRGALHWLAKNKTPHGDDQIVILTFDMMKEKLYELVVVELPDSETEPSFPMLLTNSGDSLFLLMFNRHLCFDDLGVWQLIEYGGKTSWTKVFSNRCAISEFIYWGNVFHYTKSGEVVFDCGISGLLWHDPNENTRRRVSLPFETDWSRFHRAVFIESLVLPDWYRPTNS